MVSSSEGGVFRALKALKTIGFIANGNESLDTNQHRASAVVPAAGAQEHNRIGR
jgi:hypothetical protein